MNKTNQYDWLIVVEGSRDIPVYNAYFPEGCKPTCRIRGAGGKSYVLNMSSWDPKLIGTLRNDLGRTGFKGVILMIDSDDSISDPFAKYQRGDNLPYIGDNPTPEEDPAGAYWLLDSIRGLKSLPIRGINVPRSDNGCLETDLLSAYGFPIETQTEYTSFTDIIKQATKIWKIPNNDDNKPWWEINEKSKMDKFIFSALREGFSVSGKKPMLPEEPNVISNLRMAMA